MRELDIKNSMKEKETESNVNEKYTLSSVFKFVKHEKIKRITTEKGKFILKKNKQF